jgi:hypothetical protein
MKRIACLLVTVPLAALGCTDAPIVLPRAIVDVDVGPSATVGSCGFVTSDLVSIGCAGSASKCSGNQDGRYLPVSHGSAIDSDGAPAERGVEVHVYCSIVSTANAFDVKLSALRVDPNKPTQNTEKITIYGTITPTRDPQPVTVIASNATLAGFRNGAQGCTLSFPNPDPRIMGIASGRISARIDCPDAVIPTQESRTCTVGGLIRFENCGE